MESTYMSGRMERVLPPWAPFAITAFGIVLIPLLFEIPRESEAVDTFLEAVPFFVIFLGVVSFFFSREGWSRTAGLVFALVMLFTPVWYPLALGALLDLGREPSNVHVELIILPDDDAPYTVLVPAPVDESGNLARVISEERFPAWTTETIDGVPYLRVESDGPVERSFHLGGGKDDEFWPTTEFPRQGPRSDDDPYPVVLLSGNVTVSVTMRIVGDGRYCSFDASYHAVVGSGGEGFARLSDQDMTCT